MWWQDCCQLSRERSMAASRGLPAWAGPDFQHIVDLRCLDEDSNELPEHLIRWRWVVR